MKIARYLLSYHHKLEVLPRDRLLHIIVGVTVVSLISGILVGIVSKMLRVSYLEAEAEYKRQEQISKFATFLSRAEMDINLSSAK